MTEHQRVVCPVCGVLVRAELDGRLSIHQLGPPDPAARCAGSSQDLAFLRTKRKWLDRYLSEE